MYTHYGRVGAIPTYRVYRLSDMVWTDDDTEFLLNVTLEYKTAKAAENED